MDDRKIVGTVGEDKAAEFLAGRGYRILERNFRCRSGEIDIIAMDEDAIVFVEVKTRKNDAYGRPEESVNIFKQRKMFDAARYYLCRNNFTDRDCRFDVVAVKLADSGQDTVTLFKDAFEVS